MFTLLNTDLMKDYKVFLSRLTDQVLFLTDSPCNCWYIGRQVVVSLVLVLLGDASWI